MGLRQIIQVFFRFLFGVALISLGIKGYLLKESNQGFISQNIRLISNTYFSGSLEALRKYSPNIYMLYSMCIALAGLLIVVGSSDAKLICFIVAVIDIILIHNPIFYVESKYRLMASGGLALFGAAISILK